MNIKKRYIYVAIVTLALMFSTQSFAAWTATGSIVQHGEESWVATVLLTCDGSASGALDLFTTTITGITKNDLQKINGGSLPSVSVIPGTGDVAPDGPYDVNVYDHAGVKTIDATTTSEATKHTYNTYDITGIIQQIMSSIPFDVGDIGTTGDQVTLKFNIKKSASNRR